MKKLHVITCDLSLWCVAALLVALAVCSVSAQQAAPKAGAATDVKASPTTKSPAAVDDRYRIGPGDLLSIATLDYPQLSSDSVRVDSRGMILLQMVNGEIQAACRTEGELAKEISKLYLKYLKEPQVKVFVKEYQSESVAVIGAVTSPGRFQLQRRVQLLEMLTFVNGPTERAGKSVQIIHAGGSPICSAAPDGNEDVADAAIVTLKLSETMRGNEKANPFVQPGDIITVLDADQYYILGNVARPSAYPLKEDLTLGQAIAMAGGILPDTNTQKVHIIRHSGEGAKTDVFVDLKAIAKQSAPEFVLQPNDIVEVTKLGGAGMALKGVFRAMVPMAVQLPLRVIP